MTRFPCRPEPKRARRAESAVAATIIFWLLLGLTSQVSASMARTGAAAIVMEHSGQCIQAGRIPSSPDAAAQWDCEGQLSQLWVIQRNSDAYLIINRKTNRCLAVAEGNLVEGTGILESACDGPGRFWDLSPQGESFQLVARNSGLCLAVPSASSTPGTRLVLGSCAPGSGSSLVVQGGLVSPSTPVNLIGRQSGLCLTVPNGSVSSGVQLLQQPCVPEKHDQWTLRPIGRKGAFHIVAEHSGACLAVEDGSVKEGARLVQAACSEDQAQRWRPRAISNSSYRLISSLSRQCVDVAGSSLGADATLVQSVCRRSSVTQQWNFALANAVMALPNPDLGQEIGPAAIATAPRSIWSAQIELPTVPVAAANLPNGSVLFWSSYDAMNFGPATRPAQTHTAVLNPVNGQVSARLVTDPAHDMFCPGTSNLPDGKILVNGGSTSDRTSLFDPTVALATAWQAVDRMSIPRAYQGNTVLSTGNVFTLGGSWRGGVGGKSGELYSVGANLWQPLNGVPLPDNSDFIGPDARGIYRGDNHLWLFAQADGWVFHAGPSAAMHWIDTKGAGAVLPAGKRGTDPYSINGNAVLFDVGRILKTGGAPNYDSGAAFNSAYVINIRNRAAVTVRKVAPMNEPRTFANSVVLPNGQVLVVGGQRRALLFSDSYAVLDPEIWDPITEVFTKLNNPVAVARNYHSIALLLPDARVLAGGGGLCGTCTTNHPDVQILTPPYLLKADGTAAPRPVITQAPPAQMAVGASATIKTNSPITSCVGVRMASTTHTVNNDQRRVALNCPTTGVNSYRLRIPANPGVMLPGYWMVFVLNAQGVPSVAATVKIR